jgi:hypothetical protein
MADNYNALLATTAYQELKQLELIEPTSLELVVVLLRYQQTKETSHVSRYA